MYSSAGLDDLPLKTHGCMTEIEIVPVAMQVQGIMQNSEQCTAHLSHLFDLSRLLS